MTRKSFFLILTVLMLTAATLACSLFASQQEEPVQPAEVEVILPTVKVEQPEEAAPPEQPKDSQPEIQTDLGEEIRSAQGGFAFQQIPGYTLEEFFGLASMQAPDADEDVGPFIILIGEETQEEKTADQLFEDFSSEMELDSDPEVEVTDKRSITVDGRPAIQVDLAGQQDGQNVNGRVIVAAVSPTREFTMIVSSPADRWEEVEPLVSSVLASVYFFEPEEGNLTDLEEDAVDSPDTSEGELIRQWAEEASASSEYEDDDYSAMQATGEPDTLECADLPTAWASSLSDSIEWIELEYAIPVTPTEINIIQTHAPDQVSKVEVIDEDGGYHTVYTSTPLDKSNECPYSLSIPVGFSSAIIGVKITIDQTVIGAPWNEIDAVELVGSRASDEPSSSGSSGDESSGDESSDSGTTGNDDNTDDLSDFEPEPGEAFFIITDEEGTFLAAEDNYTVDDSLPSSLQEILFGLVSPDGRFKIILAFPNDFSGVLVDLIPYNPSATVKAPSAAVYIDNVLYTGEDGLFIFEDATDDYVSGSFFFDAVNPADPNDMISVEGTFVELPLP